MFEPRPVMLILFDRPSNLGILKGIEMELEDCASPYLAGVISTCEVKTAFSDVDVAILLASVRRKEGMERITPQEKRELLLHNTTIYKEHGKALNEYASPYTKVLVVANPANTNALICSHYANRIPKHNFTSLSRLDQNRALAILSNKLQTNPSFIHNVIIWGNHSSTQYVDVDNAIIIDDMRGNSRALKAVLDDDVWVDHTLESCVQYRGIEVIKARNKNSAASVARAINDHMRNWLFGTADGEFVSMSVASDGAYGIENGLFFSFPVHCSKNGNYSILKGLHLSEGAKKQMVISQDELVQEKQIAFQFLTKE